MDENWGNDLLASRREGISKIRVHATNYSSVVPSHDSVQYSHSMTHGTGGVSIECVQCCRSSWTKVGAAVKSR